MTSDREFRAWRVSDAGDGTLLGTDQACSVGDLRIRGKIPQWENETNQLGYGDVVIDVTHSSLNHKDALSASGIRGGVTRSYPHTPGIDAAGYCVVGTGVHQTAGSVLVTGYVRGLHCLWWGCIFVSASASRVIDSLKLKLTSPLSLFPS